MTPAITSVGIKILRFIFYIDNFQVTKKIN